MVSELEELLKKIRRKYNVDSVPLKVGGKELKVVQFADFESYLEELIDSQQIGPKDLPYWARLWESSLLLAYFIGKQPLVPWQQMLEIGAGLGVAGTYASLCGHQVTITDTHEDALLFARANVLLNGAKAAVRRLDLKTPEINGPYEVIFGAEIVLDPSSYPLLVSFLTKALAPNGTAFLASSSPRVPAFFEELTKYFKFKQTVQTVRFGGEPQQVSLYAVRFKDR